MIATARASFTKSFPAIAGKEAMGCDGSSSNPGDGGQLESAV